MTEDVLKTKSFWQEAIYFSVTRREKEYLILFLTLYVPLFLLIFQPFGINNYDPSHSIGLDFLLAALGFGLVIGASMWMYEFLVVPKVFHHQTIHQRLLHVIVEVLLLSFATFFFYNYLGDFHDWHWGSFLQFVRDMGLLGSLPVGLMFLYFKYNHAKNSYTALLHRSQQGKRQQKASLVHISSDSGKDHLMVLPSSLLYIEAQDNYVAIYHLENGQVKKSLLRSTMKRLENILEDQSVKRCHRSYMINLNMVEKVNKTSHRAHIHLMHVADPIPVSRKYLSILDAALAADHS